MRRAACTQRVSRVLGGAQRAAARAGRACAALRARICPNGHGATSGACSLSCAQAGALTPHPRPPAQLGAAWRTVLGVRALTDPEGFTKQFKDAAGTKTSKALALRCGLLNLQVAALQVAACNADMKARVAALPCEPASVPAEMLCQRGASVPTRTCADSSARPQTMTKRNLHAAMAVNNFSSAALAMHNSKNNGLASNEANARMAVTVCLGALAAVTAMKEHNDM